MKRLYTIVFALLVPAFGLTSTASAQTNAGPTPPVTVPNQTEASQQIGFLLSAHHELPVKAEFEAVEGARQILERLARNATSPLGQKRALEALAYWPDDATMNVYTEVLNDPQTRVGTRHMTLILIGGHFGAEGLDLLKNYLRTDDVQLRLTAVEAIARTKTDKGFDLLQAHARVETSDLVLKQIEEKGRLLR